MVGSKTVCYLFNTLKLKFHLNRLEKVDTNLFFLRKLDRNHLLLGESGAGAHELHCGLAFNL